MRIAALTALMLGLAVAGSAEAQMFRGPCHTDSLCPGVSPGGGRLMDCLRAHRSELSMQCYAAIGRMVLNRSGHQRGGGANGQGGGYGPNGPGGPDRSYGPDNGGGPDDGYRPNGPNGPGGPNGPDEANRQGGGPNSPTGPGAPDEDFDGPQPGGAQGGPQNGPPPSQPPK